MSTFKVDEVASHWVSFQVIAGFGLGLGMQASSLAAQAVLPIPDVPTGIAIMFFAQQLGGGIFTSVGQNLLSTYLVSHLDGIPGISPDKVTGEGAADLVSSVPPEYQLVVKTVYNQAISRIFLCAMGVALVAVIAAFWMEWKNLRHTGPPGGPPPGAETKPSPLKDTKRQEPPWPLTESSRRASSDSHAFLYNAGNTVAANSSVMRVNEAPTPVESQIGCEHCEHCRLSRAGTLTPSERQSPLPPAPPILYNRNSFSHPYAYAAVYPRSPFAAEAEALEEAARLASIARESVAQLEELMRPLSYLSASTMGRHSMHGLPSRPIPACVPHHDPRHRSLTVEHTVSPRRPNREPTTEELVENARRVSAQLAREENESEEKVRLMEKRRGKEKEKEATANLLLSRSSRYCPAAVSSASANSQDFLPSRRSR